MYTEFYGLSEKPFNLTPSPKFLYLPESRNGGKHGDALAHMRYGIENRSGFVMITGEAGTGKTTICRTLAGQLDGNVELALVFNPKLTAIELLRKINREFGVASSAETVLDLVEALNEHLLEAAANGKICVLIIDEAQNLSPEVLEQIRLLSNLETDTDKLLQIILLGQPELSEKLHLRELRQLNQRITARYHLTPLDEQETLEYIAYRLHVANSRGSVRFEKAAVHLIHQHSSGTPRMINAICDRALLIGYAQGERIITKAIVQRAVREVRGEQIAVKKPARLAQARPPRFRWLGVTAAMAVIAGGSFWLGNNVTINWRGVPITPPAPGPGPETVKPAENPPPAAPSTTPAAQTPLPAPASAPVEDSFETWLAKADPSAMRQSATAALLRAWGMAPLGESPAGDAADQVVAFAGKNGLDAEVLRVGLPQVLAINLPGFIALKSGNAHCWTAILGCKEEKLTITNPRGETVEVDRPTLEKAYAGAAIVLWRDPLPEQRVLSFGRRGPEVAQLRDQLRRLGRLPIDSVSDVYDAPVKAAVSKLQHDTGLPVDEKAGKQVRMVLAGLAGPDSVPALAARTALIELPKPPAATAATPPVVSEGEKAETAPVPAPEKTVEAPVSEGEKTPVTTIPLAEGEKTVATPAAPAEGEKSAATPPPPAEGEQAAAAPKAPVETKKADAPAAPKQEQTPEPATPTPSPAPQSPPAPEAKAPEAKAPEAKAPEAKAPEAKAPEAKPQSEAKETAENLVEVRPLEALPAYPPVELPAPLAESESGMTTQGLVFGAHYETGDSEESKASSKPQTPESKQAPIPGAFPGGPGNMRKEAR